MIEAHALLGFLLAGTDASPRTVFLDFDGALVARGGGPGENPCLEEATVEISPIPGIETRQDTITRRVEHLLAAYDLHVVDEPPSELLPYDTVVFGGTSRIVGHNALLGFSCRVDCRDDHIGDVTLVFESAATEFDDQNLGDLAVHELAHSWGLEHVTDRDDVMYRRSVSSDAAFHSTCLELDDSDPIYCADHRVALCPRGGQNGHRELLARFGPSRVDATDLIAEIVSPGDQEVLRHSSFTVEIDVTDESPGVGWRMVVTDLGRIATGVDDGSVSMTLPDGEHTIELTAVDHDGDLATSSVQVVVAAQDDGGVNPTCRVDGRQSKSGALAFVVLVCAMRRRRYSETP